MGLVNKQETFTKLVTSTTSTGTTTLFVVPRRFCVQQFIITPEAVTSFTSGITYQIGTNAATYNNFRSSTTCAITGLNQYLNTTYTTTGAVFNAGDTVVLNITVAAVATTYDLKFHIIGFFV